MLATESSSRLRKTPLALSKTPPEVWLHIFSFLDEQRTFYRLLFVCKQVRDIAEAVLFKSIELGTLRPPRYFHTSTAPYHTWKLRLPSWSSLLQCIKAGEGHRAVYVHSIYAYHGWIPLTLDEWRTVTEVVKLCINLKSFTVDADHFSPNLHPATSEHAYTLGRSTTPYPTFTWPSGGLSRLTRLTLCGRTDAHQGSAEFLLHCPFLEHLDVDRIPSQVITRAKSDSHVLRHLRSLSCPLEDACGLITGRRSLQLLQVSINAGIPRCWDEVDDDAVKRLLVLSCVLPPTPGRGQAAFTRFISRFKNLDQLFIDSGSHKFPVDTTYLPRTLSYLHIKHNGVTTISPLFKDLTKLKCIEVFNTSRNRSSSKHGYRWYRDNDETVLITWRVKKGTEWRGDWEKDVDVENQG